MAQNFIDTNCIVCGVMDARCNQVYNAVFEISNGVITRITDDRAILSEDLADEIKALSFETDKTIIIVGDGTDIFYPFVEDIEKVSKSDLQRRYQNAIGVGLAATHSFNKGETLLPAELLPFYLRLPQAERELQLKKEQKK